MSDEEYESGFFPIWNILTFVLSGSEKLYHIVQRMVRYRNDSEQDMFTLNSLEETLYWISQRRNSHLDGVQKK